MTRLFTTVVLSLLLFGSEILVSAQEVPPDMRALGPVSVETLELEPTVVKSGDLITQRYRLRYPDLISEGQEIIILEDRVAPEALPVHPFEAVSLTVEKGRVDDEHIWDFIYGFRLVDPNKMTYALPNFSFYYLIRDLGENIEDAEVQQIDGGQGLVRYITSITDEPLLDVRDTIELGTFAGRATVFRTLAWSVAPLPLLVWLVLLVRSARKPKPVSLEKQQEADELARIEAQIPVPPSIWEARRAVNRQVSLLQRLPAEAGADQRLALERDVVLVLRDYLRADLPDLHSGDTAIDMQQYVDGLEDGDRKESLGVLAGRLVVYQQALEVGEPTQVEQPAEAARILAAALWQLRPHVRMLNSLKRLVGA